MSMIFLGCCTARLHEEAGKVMGQVKNVRMHVVAWYDLSRLQIVRIDIEKEIVHEIASCIKRK
ncbi:MAG: hypothetical protein CL912_04540 [Deltaproteobacteria bacterium]|nr:hypothetical protein [Deltaproteobacteria bacterium]